MTNKLCYEPSLTPKKAFDTKNLIQEITIIYQDLNILKEYFEKKLTGADTNELIEITTMKPEDYRYGILFIEDILRTIGNPPQKTLQNSTKTGDDSSRTLTVKEGTGSDLEVLPESKEISKETPTTPVKHVPKTPASHNTFFGCVHEAPITATGVINLAACEELKDAFSDVRAPQRILKKRPHNNIST